ncbi:hypothetical protein [Catenuloplanes indicus]|uniref:Uncharacterized protein n=1 Tax=Catenuloplanes indicus TaxID=137267 RepID=A0AAE3W8H2_9ACTN|nr:hypothetical protein [Catenuloplanes indicus]MDQ0371571.1 hypothetical protein [Catenuloplanes indicus]
MTETAYSTDNPANAVHLRGPWQVVLSVEGQVLDTFDHVDATDEIDICICRGTAIPKNGGWPDTYSGDDEIELWTDLEYDEARVRWIQAQAMAAGLNAALAPATTFNTEQFTEIRNAVKEAAYARRLGENAVQALAWRTQAVLERRARAVSNAAAEAEKASA